MFQEMPVADQKKWIVKFEEEALPGSGAMRKSYQSKGIASPIVRPAFLKFLGNSVWEDSWERPTDSELIDLALQSRNEQRSEIDLRHNTKGRFAMGIKKA